ncbi:MAG: T9SS type A sorting domain-containing protein, partial [Flavobacteriales bacterium]|nr:T9SS type A sorting domain-containing protein [Flavobacteriales bacterium]
DVNVADCPGPCLADAGTLTADPAEVCLVNGLAPLMAVPNGDGFIPPGYIAVFALSDGTTIISGADDPEFTVVSLGSYTIHTFVVDTLTFELGSVIFGTTTIAEVNSMLIQGGGDICGSLDLNGTTIEVIGCPPANDACSAATPLAVQLPENCPAAATVGDNTFAVEEGDGPSCDPTTAGYTDVWYTFNSGANTEVTISLDPGTMTSWGLVVLDACNGNEVLCEVEGVDPLVVATTVDTEYRVRVYTNTQFGTGGVFAICVSGAEEATICDGGSLSTSEDISSLTICSDGEADVVEFFTTSTSSLDYAYFLTTVEDTIVTGLSGNSIDLDPAPLGNYRVWGVSYDGVLNNANTGNSIADISATGECLEWSDDFISVSIEICTDMADRAERSWGIHPNPVVDVLNLSWTTDGMATVEVLDANGRVLQVSQARMVSGGRTMLSFHGMASGVYVIRITTEGARNVARVIVR